MSKVAQTAAAHNGTTKGGAAHNGKATTHPGSPAAIDWPEFNDLSIHGPAGALVEAIYPHSEADRAALLTQTLAAFGNCIGRTAHWCIEGDRHYCNLFVALVGATSKGRKGSSWSHIRRFFEGLDPDWEKHRVRGGLSSGEGLVWAVRDPIYKKQLVGDKGDKHYEDVLVDEGVKDKRLLCLEPEFSSVLKAMGREGNILSGQLRDLWDGRHCIETLVKNSPARATDAHGSVIAHTAAEELRRFLTSTEQANGLANRFIWCLVRRSKCLPFGGQPDNFTMETIRLKFLDALAFARDQGAIDFDDEAREYWARIYPALSEGKPGLSGAMVGRAEAQVRRMATIYSLLDQQKAVNFVHLWAAELLWRYAEESVFAIFGRTVGDPDADEILLALKSRPSGMTREDIRLLFSGHRSSDLIERALELLAAHKLVHGKKSPTGGRPETRWLAGPEPEPE